ncbi:MAG: EAL domain-containing protein [Methylophilaceae bacterium]|nr:EAL domain-containing protein [Methyloradius sp.]
MKLSDFVRFSTYIADTTSLYPVTIQPVLVGISILVAVIGVYMALKVIPRIQIAETKPFKTFWILVGALTMGISVWSMHFIGMLALELPCGVSYEPLTTLASMIPAVLASAVALIFISKKTSSNLSIFGSSLLLGAGIGTMHYSGMAAMRLPGYVSYDPYLFCLSIVVAVLLAFIALECRDRLSRFSKSRDLVAALVMGAAISGMHYTATSAAYFIKSDIPLPTRLDYFSTSYLAVIIIMVLLLLAALIVTSVTAYRYMSIAKREERWRLALEAVDHAVWDWNVVIDEVSYSPQLAEKYGIPSSTLRNPINAIKPFIHPDDYQNTVQKMQDYVAGKIETYEIEYRSKVKTGEYRWVLSRGMVIARNEDGKPTRIVGTHTDITEKRGNQMREIARNHILELLAKGAPLQDILHVLVNSAEEQNSGMICSILLIDNTGLHMRTAAAPSLPAFYSEAIDGLAIGIGVGCCGTACYTGERVIAEDIRTHPYWKDYKGIGIKANLGACWSEPIKSSTGKVLGSFAIYHHQPSTPTDADIQLIEQNANLAGIAIEKSMANEQLELASLVYQNASEGMLVTDANQNIIAVNSAFTEITGYPEIIALGQNPRILSSGKHDAAFFSHINTALQENGSWKGELWNRHQNGQEYLILISIDIINDSQGNIERYVSLFSDITEKKKSEELIWQQANFDALTQLPNRRLFREKMEHEIIRSQRDGLPMAILFIDLDRFKEVNDTLGHDMGDVLLIEASKRIKNAVRESDTVARLGGDEFTIIIPDLHEHTNVERIAHNILHSLSQPFALSDDMSYVSGSIGITFYPDDATEIDELLKNADQAMYAAKENGRNRFHYFTADMQKSAQSRIRLANDLRVALARNELLLHYQPIVELSTGNIFKAEALLRWQHPKHGLVSPAEFIPIAEDTGLIVAIGDWVFEEAAKQALLWRVSHDPEFQISVNKSPVQFRNNGEASVDWIAQLLDLKLPGHGIVIEITEGLLLDAASDVTTRLLQYRDAGIQVAIDDFGTGYSSLSYLKKFDIDYLKIDQSFVRNLKLNSNDMALCEAIIVMAHKLGIKVIAEGIETEEQRQLLIQAGCDFGQGYLFSRPVIASSFDTLLMNNKDA